MRVDSDSEEAEVEVVVAPQVKSRHPKSKQQMSRSPSPARPILVTLSGGENDNQPDLAAINSLAVLTSSAKEQQQQEQQKQQQRHTGHVDPSIQHAGKARQSRRVSFKEPPREIKPLQSRYCSVRVDRLHGRANVVETDFQKELGPCDVEIKVLASEVSSTDYARQHGLRRTHARYSLGALLGRFKSFNTGQSCIGVVRRVGAMVRAVAVGDRVACMLPQGGGHSQSLIVHEDAHHMYVLPAEYNELDVGQVSAMLLPWTSAYNAIDEVANVQKGETVLVQGGTGAMGSALVQLAYERGAHVLFTCESAKDPRAMRMLKFMEHNQSEMPLTPLENEAPKSTDSPTHNGHTPLPVAFSYKDIHDVIRRCQAIDGGGVDVVFDGVGQAGYKVAMNCLRPNGNAILLGQHWKLKAGRAVGKSCSNFNMRAMWYLPYLSYQRNMNGQSTSFVTCHQHTKHYGVFMQNLKYVLGLLHSGKVLVDVAERVSLSQVEEALQRLGRGGSKNVHGRIVYVASIFAREESRAAIVTEAARTNSIRERASGMELSLYDDGGGESRSSMNSSMADPPVAPTREEYLEEMSEIREMMERVARMEEKQQQAEGLQMVNE